MGRVEDLFKLPNNKWVSSMDMENHILSFPEIEQVAVVAPSPTSPLTCFLVLKNKADNKTYSYEKIKLSCKSLLGGIYNVKSFVVIDNIEVCPR